MSGLPLNKNRVVIASAGSGKTTWLVKEAVASPQKRIAFVTYTNQNLLSIRDSFLREVGCVTPNVTLLTWYSFLLSHGVRPYHNQAFSGNRVTSINFSDHSAGGSPARRSIPESNTGRYYFDRDNRIYNDKIAQYICKCDDISKGLVMNRLSGVFDQIFIDEIQDLSGWDLDLLRKLFSSGSEVALVGDPRQATYSTNPSPKNSRFKGARIVDYFNDLQKKGLCRTQSINQSHRCIQPICDLADGLYPNLPSSKSLNYTETGHDGIFRVTKAEVDGYAAQFSPIALRWRSSVDTHGITALNFGEAKGLTFDRVLIFPTSEMAKYLDSGFGDNLKDEARAKLYVAITRARYSVAYVT